VLSALTAERVRRDIDVLAHAGLDVSSFVAEVDASLRRALPHEGACYALIDPATRLLTQTFKTGGLLGRDDRDLEWGFIEYGGEEQLTFVTQVEQGHSAVGMYEATGGDICRSQRVREFLLPYFGYEDELRVIASSGDQTWGGLAVFRGPDQPFTPDEIEFAATLSSLLAVGLRSGLLTRLATTAPAGDVGPAVIVFGADDQLAQISVGAERRLQQLVHAANVASPVGVLAGLVTRARAFAAGRTDVLPRLRVRLSTGEWFVLHASPLAGRDGVTGDVVITIEEARPPEIVPLVVAAFDLTSRERDVIQLVLQGIDTREIAATLHLSAYTVQDHLKAIFEKAGVRSRRELVARVFFDQYVPRLGGEIAPSGWFAEDA
jgi:DNA-binding CsgD family transcriptional regulator